MKKRLFLLVCIFLLVACNSESENLKEENKILSNRIIELESLLSHEEGKNQRLKDSKEDLQVVVNGLEEDIQDLNKQIHGKQFDLFPHSFYHGMLESDTIKVLVEKESHIKLLPYDHAMNINYVIEKSVVTVLDKAIYTSDSAMANEEYWYYVIVQPYDTPINTRGWIKASETVPYTLENQETACNPLEVRDGSKIYEGYTFPSVLESGYDIASGEVGYKAGEENGYLRIGSIGGRSFWTKKENIIYPAIE